jgi:DNA primase
MRIPQEKIEEIKNSVSIVDFISQYVPLKKAGKNYRGLCPFHTEKTPSFMVSDQKQIFHCFGCHKGGNVFTFLMEYKKISFYEAVEEIAQYAGIPLKFEKDSASKDATELLYEINLQAAKFFSDKLLNSPEGERAREYFKERKIKLATQRAFGLGYAPDSWSALKNHLEELKLPLDKAIELGLLDRKEKGAPYDKFRGRVIFPIFSTNGRVVGFGGRVLVPSEKAPKYLNSPESRIYSKRRTLYGLYHSKEEIMKLDSAILVEGYMDLISLYQAGIKNVVASSGTALTEEQVQLLSRFTKNIVVLFDADSAGQSAAMRSIELLLKQDFEIRMLTLPEGEDPDSFVNKYGVEEFREELSRTMNFLEFQMRQFEKAGMLEDPAKQAQAIRELIKTAALISDELKRNLHLRNIARKFNLREKMLEQEMDKFIRLAKKSEVKRRNVTKLPPVEKEKQAGGKAFLSGGTFEREIIRLLFEGKKEIMDLIFDNVPINEISDTNLRQIAESVFENYRNGVYLPSDLIDDLPSEELKDLTRELILNEAEISRRWEEIAVDGSNEIDLLGFTKELVNRYKLKMIDKMMREIQEQISMKENSPEALEELFEQLRIWQNEKKELLELVSKNAR